jgi:hypothetical protein
LGLVLSQYLSHGSRYSGSGIDDDGGMEIATEGSADTGDSAAAVATGGRTVAAGDNAGADAEERRRDGRNG